MKIRKEKQEHNSLFKDVKHGQCFKHYCGGFYIKMVLLDSLNNCVDLVDGCQGISCEQDRVKIFENAEIVLNG